MPTINIVKTVSNLASVTGLSFTATAVQGVNTFSLTATYSAPNLTLTSVGSVGVSGNFTFNVTANYTAFGTACSDNISFVECLTNYTTQYRGWSMGNDTCAFAVGVYGSNLASYYSLISNTEFSDNNATWSAPSVLVQNDCSLFSSPPLLRYSKSIYGISATVYGRLTFSDGVILLANNNFGAVGMQGYTINTIVQLNDYQTSINFAVTPPTSNLSVTLNYISAIDNLVKNVVVTGDGTASYNYLLNDRIKNQTIITSVATTRQSSFYVNFVPEVVC